MSPTLLGLVRSADSSSIAKVSLWTAALTVLDIAAVAGAGWILWMTAGTSMIDGSTPGQVGFILFVTGWATLRRLFVHRVGQLGRGIAAMVLSLNHGLRLLLLAGLVVAWSFSGLYYLGWLATLSAVLTGVDALFRFVGAVATPTGAAGRQKVLPPVMAAIISIVMLTGALLALIFAAELHHWHATLLNGLVLLVGAGAVIGEIAAAVLARKSAPLESA